MGISLGLVGVGMFGKAFIELFRKHPEVDEFALCDLNKQRLRQVSSRYGISETYSSLEEICKSDVEALVIITQHWLHARQSIEAMRAGKHVYSAVPTANSLEECDALVKTVEETGMVYMLGETSYFYPESFFCRKKAEEGAFGGFVHCRAEYFHDMSHGLYEVYENRWGKEWGRDKMGHPPMLYPTHSVCFPVSIMKAHMTEVSAHGYTCPNDDWFREDTMYGNPFSNETGLFRMSNGATALISEFRRVGHIGCVRANGVYGTEGSFEHDLDSALWTDKENWKPVDLAKLRESLLEPLPEPLASNRGGHQGSHAYLVHEFVDSVSKQRLPRINVWEAVRYCAPGIVAHQSAMLKGKVLKVPDWGDPSY